MAELEFFANFMAHVYNIKRSFFSAENTIKDNVHENVAEFFADFIVIFIAQGVNEFVDFFYSIGLE
jgi:hypothetical protein